MLALYRSGRQAEALAAYRAARSALDELGLEPSEHLRRLERSILNQEAGLATPIVSELRLPGPLALKPSSPFVGRERELATLRSLLRRAEDGHGQVALVGGEAGVGKSRLVRELAREATERGTLVLYGGADATANAPYQPFVEALEFLSRVSDAEAPDLDFAPAYDGEHAATARHRLHASVGTLLAQVSVGRPLLVIIEDVQWADAASLQLLRELARTTGENRIVLLATHRNRREDMRAESSESLVALTRIGGVSRIVLRRLRDNEVADFVRASTGNEVADVTAIARAARSLTDGLPFLLCELWREVAEADWAVTADDALRLTSLLSANAA